MENKHRLYPTPPHTDVSFFFREAEARKNWRLVCQALLERLAPTGDLDVVRQSKPVFELVSDLPKQRSDLDVGSDASLATWRDIMLGMQSDLWPVRAGFTYEGNRRGIVQQYTLTEVPSAIGSHPIAITLGTEALDTADFEGMNSAARARVLKGAAFALDLFRRICGSGEVLYGAILTEKPLPTPRALAKHGRGIEPEFFVSEELSRAKPGTDGNLAALFPGAVVEKWSTGTYFSRWAPFNSEQRTAPIARDAPGQAGGILAEALIAGDWTTKS